MYAVRKTGDNYGLYFKGKLVDVFASKATALKWKSISEQEYAKRQSATRLAGSSNPSKKGIASAHYGMGKFKEGESSDVTKTRAMRGAAAAYARMYGKDDKYYSEFGPYLQKNPKATNKGIPIGKFIPARLNPDGTVTFKVYKKHKPAKKRTARKKAKKTTKRKR
jgi:hypothetical protein